MNGKHCKLFDENLVHNIMISTGLSLFEYLRENKNTRTEDILHFVEMNASSIIEETIEHLNKADDPAQCDDDNLWQDTDFEDSEDSEFF
ncbi:hypothetical protein CHISP_1848 [Chitinispirillum alkaliphilum]|nr:hypothetical protein CHISP_1848 [Chitinispirillum alkaliphilum]